MKIVIFLFLMSYPLFAEFCYSIKTDVDEQTPISPLSFKGVYLKESCPLLESPRLYGKFAYIGCYKNKKSAELALKNMKFPFKNPKIIYHKKSPNDPYIIFPKKSTLSLKDLKKRLDYVYKNYTIAKVLKKFPKRFYGNGIDIIDFKKIVFLPFSLFYLYNKVYKKIGKEGKSLILYDGVYSLDMLYKKLKNPNLIKKIGKNRYELKISIIVSPTASLVFQNKVVYLSASPKPIFIVTFGKLYAKHCKFLAWDMRHNHYLPRKKVPERKLLYLDYEKPRPFFAGWNGSKIYFVDNIFKGLGFHSVPATFGISLIAYPSNMYLQSILKGFRYFLTQFPHPEGVFIGNDISESPMAFYTNGAYNSVFLGNYTHDNVIYNFDPHDYSKNLIMARNLSTHAGHAHGIIVSREVDDSIIAENIVLRNHSNGIMLDRYSNNNYIYKNLSLGNGYMGASLQESKNNLLVDNIFALNYIDGIMVRNSLKSEVISNVISFNGNNGVEVSYKNIDNIPGRDLVRDPYIKASSLFLKKNRILDNFNTNIMVKNSAAVKIEDNILKGLKNYGGDLNYFTKNIIKNGGTFTLYGRGFPFKKVSRDKFRLNSHIFKDIKNIYVDIFREGNDFTGKHLGILYLFRKNNHIGELELKRAANLINKDGSLSFLGYFYLAKAINNRYKNKQMILDGLSYIIEDKILKNSNSMIYLEELKYFMPNGKNLIQKAFKIAVSRMLDGRIFSKYDYNNCVVCKNSLIYKSKIKSSVKLFLYKTKLINAKNFLQYCKIVDKNFTTLTQDYVKQIKRVFLNHRKSKDAYNNFLENQKNIAKKNQLCIDYLNKKEEQQEQIKKIFSLKEKDVIKKLLPTIRIMLQKINKYRVRKISINEILKIFKEPPGSKYKFFY